MSHHEINNSKVVVVSGLINSSDGANVTANIPLSQFITLEFVPDYAILKYVSVMCKNAANGSFNSPLIITSDLGYLDNNNLISVNPLPMNNVQVVPNAGGNNIYYNFCNQQCDVHIKLPNFVNKSYTFNINVATGSAIIPSTFLYIVGLTFEFIKFKKPFMLPEFNEKKKF